MLEISVKSGEDSTGTLSLVIHGERKKEPGKKSINPQGGVKLRKHPVFLFFLSTSTAAT
jgi:hypothetical protein